jgi:stage V sporulation protein G
MKITEVKVFPVQEEKLKAFVSIVLDECFMVNDIKIIRGKDGLFISMPSRRKKNGRFKDVAHPLNNDTRQVIEGLILGEYERIIGVDSSDGAATDSDAADSDVAFAVVPPKGRPMGSEVGAAAMAASAESEPKQEEEPEGAEEPSLEEVTELHLKDSFWTT